MRVIDLLVKIANGEKSIPINYNNSKRDLTYYLYVKCGNECDDRNLQNILNTEVEIIEEDKKIEKLSWYSSDELQESMINKINEIIDCLEENK